MNTLKTEKSQSSFAKVTTQPLKFGSRNDLKIAITELAWVNDNNGKLVNQDFENVSLKYDLPSGFLKDVIKGQVTQENFCVTKSKWYPIYYAWLSQDKEHSFNLYKLQFDYIRSRFWYMSYIVFLIIGFFYIGYALVSIFNVDVLNLLAIIVIPLLLSVIAFVIDFRNSLIDKKAKLNEHVKMLVTIGVEKIVASNKEFVNQQMFGIIFASDILLKKINQGSTLIVDAVGTYDDKSSNANKKSSKQKQKIPAFILVEVSEKEYIEKIKELAKKKITVPD